VARPARGQGWSRGRTAAKGVASCAPSPPARSRPVLQFPQMVCVVQRVQHAGHRVGSLPPRKRGLPVIMHDNAGDLWQHSGDQRMSSIFPASYGNARQTHSPMPRNSIKSNVGSIFVRIRTALEIAPA
jgi:hypothetical protein